MKLLSIDQVKFATVAELLAPWPGGGSYSRSTYHRGKLLHRTSVADEAPDLRYWTPYDHFMTEYEARVQRAAYLCGALERGYRKLSAALARLVQRALGHARPAN